jgi:hypothetical protein
MALDDVSITSLSFGKEFTHAMEAKQVAAQEAERAKFIFENAEQDMKSAIIRAQVHCLFPLFLFIYLLLLLFSESMVPCIARRNGLYYGSVFLFLKFK